MARRKAAAPKRGGSDPGDRLIEAALALAARQGWRRLGLGEIAAEAGLPLHQAYALHRSKASILRAFIRRIDEQVLAGGGGDKNESARERLFDTLMRRFEALRPYKAGLRAILRDSVGRPTALFGVPVLRRSMAWMLESSGIATAGCRGRLLVSLVLSLYASVLWVFFQDESSDLSRTMAALDRGLRRGEAWCRLAGRGGGSAPGRAAA